MDGAAAPATGEVARGEMERIWPQAKWGERIGVGWCGWVGRDWMEVGWDDGAWRVGVGFGIEGGWGSHVGGVLLGEPGEGFLLVAKRLLRQMPNGFLEASAAPKTKEE